MSDPTGEAIKQTFDKFDQRVTDTWTRLGLKRMFGKPGAGVVTADSEKQGYGMWLVSVAPVLAMFVIIALSILFLVIVAPMVATLTVTSSAFQNRSRNTQVQTANLNMRNQYMDDAYNRSNSHTERFGAKKIDESALRGYAN